MVKFFVFNLILLPMTFGYLNADSSLENFCSKQLTNIETEAFLQDHVNILLRNDQIGNEKILKLLSQHSHYPFGVGVKVMVPPNFSGHFSDYFNSIGINKILDKIGLDKPKPTETLQWAIVQVDNIETHKAFLTLLSTWDVDKIDLPASLDGASEEAIFDYLIKNKHILEEKSKNITLIRVEAASALSR